MEARRLLRERSIAPREFLLGVSTHSVQSVRQAASGGSDYVIYGPVFATQSKAAYGAPQGLDQLALACHLMPLPVIAIGGVNMENVRECITAGAAGIAAIRLFQNAASIGETARALRAKAQRS
jgi:thiamine-phosphate pyrophosphorylase